MDILSLLSATVPSYFVIGPLVIIVITLVVLAARKASPVGAPVSTLGTTPTIQATVALSNSAQPAPASITSLPQVILPQPQPVPVPLPVVVENPVVSVVPPPSPESVLPQAPLPGELATPLAQVEVVTPLPVAPQVIQEPVAPQVIQEPVTPLSTQVPVTEISGEVPVVAKVEVSVPATNPATNPAPIPTGVIPPISSWKTSTPVIVPVDPSHTEAQMQAEAVLPATPASVQ